MIERKEFDLADAVILLDLYIRGQQRGATVSEIAKEASNLYRSLAIRQGLAISESYRPVDGLVGRIKSLQITYERVEIKGKRPTRVFEEAVTLYRTNPKEFEAILNEALGQVDESTEPMSSLRESDGSVNIQSERQEQFYTWLSGQVSRTIGLTVSIGVSFNKIFAKLGSDMKKPDAVTVISQSNFRDKIWPLAASELLYVGPATTRKLRMLSVNTIGDLAKCAPDILRAKLGKNGLMLWTFANGWDCSPVMPADYTVPVKSVGHGTTCVRDLDTDYEVWQVLYELAQDVGHRLREYGLTAKGVQITVRDKDLDWRQYQHPLHYPTQSPLEIALAGFALFREMYRWEKPVRALTIRGINMGAARDPVQIDMFNDYRLRERRRALDTSIITDGSTIWASSTAPSTPPGPATAWPSWYSGNTPG